MMKCLFFTGIMMLFSWSMMAQKKTAKPNIILIVADDLGYGDLGCYGQEKIETPNLDKFAKEGLLFTEFYAGTSVCAPSRASLLTGLHTGHTAVRGNKGTEPEGQFPLPGDSKTFVNYLQEAGYATAAFGKWGLGFITTSGAPDKKGFDEFYGYNCQTLAHNYYPDHLWKNRERVDLSVNQEKDSVYSAQLIQEQAIRFLRMKRNNPYFLFLPYTLPHAELDVPHDSLYQHYILKFNEKPLVMKNTGKQEHHFEPYPHAAYAAMVGRLDNYVGEIIAMVKSKGELENTLIIFTSDNGPHKENGGDPGFFNSSGGLKGIKRDLYEGGIRVPFIASWKGKIQAAKTSQPGAFWDLYPTFLELTGMIGEKNRDGISILPTLLNKNKQSQHEFYYWEFHENNGRQAVRWGNWKGVKLNVGKEANAALELYDLENDPAETNNISALHPGIVQRLELIIKNAHTADKDWPLLVNEEK